MNCARMFKYFVAAVITANLVYAQEEGAPEARQPKSASAATSEKVPEQEQQPKAIEGEQQPKTGVVGTLAEKEKNPGPPGENGSDFLEPNDIVGTTFYIACNMMFAFTLFFFVQVGQVPKRWATSVSIAGLVTGVAWYNYTYMKDQWVKTGNSPTTYRYTDWLITVPLQIVEFYFILKASKPVDPNLGVKLFSASLMMVLFGWMAENNITGKLPGFLLGCACWLYIVYETFAGEASQHALELKSEASRKAFNYVRLIVAVGWIIYPLGFMIAYIIPGPTIRPNGEGPPYDILNLVYNLADLVNKGAFGLAIWSAAVADKDDEKLLG